MELRFRAVDVRPPTYFSDSTAISCWESPQGKAQPDPNHCGEKRKRNEEWSCALCQVSATSEQGLIQHIQGKKHRRKEQKLRVNKHAKRNPKTDNPVVRKLKKKSTVEFKTSKKFKLWCEMCRIGAYSAVVMEAHENGKKHLARLQQLGQNGETVSTMAAMESSSEAGGTEEKVEAVAENAANDEIATEIAADNEAVIGLLAGNDDAENVALDVDGSGGASM